MLLLLLLLLLLHSLSLRVHLSLCLRLCLQVCLQLGWVGLHGTFLLVGSDSQLSNSRRISGDRQLREGTPKKSCARLTSSVKPASKAAGACSGTCCWCCCC